MTVEVSGNGERHSGGMKMTGQGKYRLSPTAHVREGLLAVALPYSPLPRGIGLTCFTNRRLQK